MVERVALEVKLYHLLDRSIILSISILSSKWIEKPIGSRSSRGLGLCFVSCIPRRRKILHKIINVENLERMTVLNIGLLGERIWICPSIAIAIVTASYTSSLDIATKLVFSRVNLLFCYFSFRFVWPFFLPLICHSGRSSKLYFWLWSINVITYLVYLTQKETKSCKLL